MPPAHEYPPPVKGDYSTLEPHLPLVYAECGRVGRLYQVNPADLFGAAWVTLCRALDTWDPDKGAWSTHAIAALRCKVFGAARLQTSPNAATLTSGRTRRRRDGSPILLYGASTLGDDDGRGSDFRGRGPLSTIPARDEASAGERALDRLAEACFEAEYLLDDGIGDMVALRARGWTLDRIGRELGITKEAVRQRIHRAAKTLAELSEREAG